MDWGIVLGVVGLLGIPLALAVLGLTMAATTPGEFRFVRGCFYAAAIIFTATIFASLWNYTEGSEPMRVLAAALAGAAMFAGMAIALDWTAKKKSAVVKPNSQNAALDIRFDLGPTYEVSEVTNGRILSTVRIGLKAIGKPLSNCKVYIEKIAPQPSIAGGLPILLERSGFILRPDDPETIIDIAAHWNHVSQFRFSSPIGGAFFAEALNYLPDDIERVIEVKVVATELQKTALFKIWTDESKKLHLQPM